MAIEEPPIEKGVIRTNDADRARAQKIANEIGNYYRDQVDVMRGWLKENPQIAPERWTEDLWSEYYAKIILEPGFVDFIKKKRIKKEGAGLEFKDLKYYRENGILPEL